MSAGQELCCGVCYVQGLTTAWMWVSCHVRAGQEFLGVLRGYGGVGDGVKVIQESKVDWVGVLMTGSPTHSLTLPPLPVVS